MNTTQNSIAAIIEIMSRDMIYIPKAVMKREDVYEESKMMFSIIFTDCLKSIAENGRTADTVNQMMKVRLNELSTAEICWTIVNKVDKKNDKFYKKFISA